MVVTEGNGKITRIRQYYNIEERMSKYFECPECGNSFEADLDIESGEEEFCPNCGCPIIWEDEDEEEDDEYVYDYDLEEGEYEEV
jgi:hypothetical protein